VLIILNEIFYCNASFIIHFLGRTKSLFLNLSNTFSMLLLSPKKWQAFGFGLFKLMQTPIFIG